MLPTLVTLVYTFIFYSVNFIYMNSLKNDYIVLVTYVPLMIIFYQGWILRSTALSRVSKITKLYANSLIIIQFFSWSILLVLRFIQIENTLTILNFSIIFELLFCLYLSFKLYHFPANKEYKNQLDHLANAVEKDKIVERINEKNRMYVPLFISAIPGNGYIYVPMYLMTKILMIKKVFDIYKLSEKKKYIVFSYSFDFIGVIVIVFFAKYLNTFSMVMIISILTIPDFCLKAQIQKKYE